MTQVNLLPPEVRQRAVVRRNTIIAGAVGAGLIALMVLLFLMQGSKLAGVNRDIAAQDRTNAGLRSQAAGLSQYASLKSEADSKLLLLKKVYANEVSMSSLMQEVSDVMPSDAYLTSFSITVDDPGAETVSPSGLTKYYGTVTFSGNAYRLDTLPLWLDRLGSVNGFANPLLSSYTESQAGTLLYQFQSSADLTRNALTLRGQHGNDAVTGTGG